jgi:hypothetical protein
MGEESPALNASFMGAPFYSNRGYAKRALLEAEATRKRKPLDAWAR